MDTGKTKSAAVAALVVSMFGINPSVTAVEESKSRSDSGKSFYDFAVRDIDGKEVKLSQYTGDVCLVVNVASKCGLTPQYTGLEALYKKHKDQGFRILGFPANNFLGQEPGTNAQIKKFCSTKYNVTFDLFAKISVKGEDQAPLYRFLTQHSNKEIAGDVQWNFQKYLVGRDGKVMAKFSPRTKPDDEKLREAIETALAAQAPDTGKSAAPAEKPRRTGGSRNP
jgi:glutathione peroxidase